jgi:hypothetical protein
MTLPIFSRFFLSVCVRVCDVLMQEIFRWMLQRRFDLETDVRPMGTWPDWDVCGYRIPDGSTWLSIGRRVGSINI